MAMHIAVAWIPFVLASVAQGQVQEWRPKDPRIPAAQIDAAIRKGLGWLKSQPSKSGVPGNRLDDTNELVLYTLLHGGIASSDPAVGDLLRHIVDRDADRVYNVALGAMGLAKLDRAGYQWKIAQHAHFLVDNQCENGQWAYGSPVEWDPRVTGEWVVQKTGLYGLRFPPGYRSVPGKPASGGRKIAIRQRGPGDEDRGQFERPVRPRWGCGPAARPRSRSILAAWRTGFAGGRAIRTRMAAGATAGARMTPVAPR